MYIQIRTADCSQSKRVEVSKLTSVTELKSLVEGVLNVKPERQRLFFRGKQLEDGYKIFDYCINLNDVVILMVKPELLILETSAKSEGNGKECGKPSASNEIAHSKYYKVGNIIEALDDIYGAWFEGKIVEIVKKTESVSNTVPESVQDSERSLEAKHSADNLALQDDGLLYMVSLNVCPDDPPIGLALQFIRPVMNILIKLTDIQVGQMVHVNYNIEYPNKRGFWYDMLVTDVSSKEGSPKLIGNLFVGKQQILLEHCRIVFTDEVVRFTKPTLPVPQRSKDDIAMTTDSEYTCKAAPVCTNCQDNPQKKCKNCACHVCGGKDEPERQLLCDECNNAYHLRCLNPPLDALPDIEEWYCPDCKNDQNEIVKAGDKLKESKKKKNLPSAKNSAGKRDWGKGMACAGRTKNCTIVRPNHFGPIPGIDVGTCWMYRITASEAGIHRPPVSGIHGRDSQGAYSIVLSGGYEDDVDNGEEFYYTGSGGRDLKGNKRTSEQSCDQRLTRMNLALAINCNAPVNKDEGAEAEDWKGGKPVRVIRNFKLAKHSKYAPEEGNRYDGIYKVVKYYPEKGQSGFLVWRYLLRRDDPTPPPWTDEGKKHIEKLGLTMIRPDGYEDMMAIKEAAKEAAEEASKSKSKKRKHIPAEGPNIKKAKVDAYELDVETDMKINQDEVNKKLWDACKVSLKDGKMKFHVAVQEEFLCICCQEVVFDPITTTCNHNVCKTCLRRSFLAQVYNCPCCRHELGKTFKLAVNENLSSALRHLFPGYEIGR